MFYLIYKDEVIDETDNWDDAVELRHEYELAFNYTITIREEK